ncbi:hypothetical protein GA0070622_1217 [Micromonospora sediminicola]|uniref:Uncharacterized protein n=1 Tax=Micromonospora sediminicola TaxID=946078 RepID=A0A1A9B5Q9_9ACTN|nr:hypothetical protein [Micromonospora sediminicola]SBT64247.1 hypothetical protein GA0070622_1217 [Micromonospora sediminicola]
MPDLPVYERWRDVPTGFYTKTQLADLDLPRQAGGPVAAYVATRDWRDRKTTVPLYAWGESVPSPASLAQLEAARRRGGAGRVCDGCGARPDRPAIAGDGGRHWCPACARIQRLRAAVAAAAAGRIDAVLWAAGLIAADAPPAVVVRAWEITRPPSPAGRRNPRPIAVRVDAVDTTGVRLVDATLRLAGPRVRAVPENAVDPATLAEPMRRLLTAPVIVTWSGGEVDQLRWLYDIERPKDWPPAYIGGNPNALWRRATCWRGEVDPDDPRLELRGALDPGTAERTLLVLRRMAATDLTATASP